MKKKISLILVFSIISFSCAAQKKIASLNDKSTIKANTFQYHIEKSEKMVTVENTTNKFTKIKQLSPNTPNNMGSYYYSIKIDGMQIKKICAAAIPLNELEELSKNSPLGILITIKSDIKGNPLEVSFFTDENSILTLNQLEEIETNIKKSIKLIIKPEADQFIKGSNFLVRDTRIGFDEILKVKKTM